MYLVSRPDNSIIICSIHSTCQVFLWVAYWALRIFHSNFISAWVFLNVSIPWFELYSQVLHWRHYFHQLYVFAFFGITQTSILLKLFLLNFIEVFLWVFKLEFFDEVYNCSLKLFWSSFRFLDKCFYQTSRFWEKILAYLSYCLYYCNKIWSYRLPLLVLISL